MKIDYKFNGGRGAVLCRRCRVIPDENISYEEAVKEWTGRDICNVCLSKSLGEQVKEED